MVYAFVYASFGLFLQEGFSPGGSIVKLFAAIVSTLESCICRKACCGLALLFGDMSEGECLSSFLGERISDRKQTEVIGSSQKIDFKLKHRGHP